MARLRAKRVRALLGPTNTGKTHRAIEAMLRHKSGMFGLPLRLLAREVYDRVSAATSPDQVALVTGEEKVIPERPRYWICTVEAMPVDQRVAFVGIDEVQLAADRQRGHVFTDRILHCRGLEETVFMGSDRMTALLTELVPEVEVEQAPRFSQLTHQGSHSLRSLPKRSAVVAFSAEQVYSLAERLKATHGGAAVVLGALSPRTRNAQVELYQSGRVKHLVATDAIGMGLNLDLQHVALASDRKYDGRGFRPLAADEVGQIAGRAGRYKTDGTFGALRPLELDDELVEAVEQHRFAPVKQLFWRNSRLSVDTVEELLASLELRPHHPALKPLRNLDDEHALVVLSRDPAIAERAVGPEGVARLWEVCQVPDFRKTLTDAHLRLLRELALHRLGRGVLPDSWVADRIGRLDRVDGDIETLMSRIAWIRTWTYIAYRPDWIEDRKGWQERTRAIEDRLSDALHTALTERFVDPLRHTARRLEDVTLDGDRILVGGVEVATLVGLDVVAEHGLPGGMRAAVEPVIQGRLQALLDGGELEVDDEHRITWEGSVLADLQPGPTLLDPKIRMRRLELLSGVDKNRLSAHLEHWVRSTIDGLTQRLTPAKRHSPGVRGVLYQLTQGLGSVPRSALVTELDALDDEERRDLARAGVRIGLQTVYLPASLKPRAQAVRARLWCVRHGIVPTWRPPSGTAAWAGELPGAYWSAIGFQVVGDVAVRCDVLEAAAADLRRTSRKGPFELPESVISRLALGNGAAHTFVVGLGYRHGEGRYVAPRARRSRR